MKGFIITDKRYGWRWLYVPEENLRFHATFNQDQKLTITALITDGYYLVSNQRISTTEFLKRTFIFEEEIEIPDHVVRYAVIVSNRNPQGIEALENEYETLTADTETTTVLSAMDDDRDVQYVEDAIGMQIWKLLPNPTNTRTGDE